MGPYILWIIINLNNAYYCLDHNLHNADTIKNENLHCITNNYKNSSYLTFVIFIQFHGISQNFGNFLGQSQILQNLQLSRNREFALFLLITMQSVFIFLSWWLDYVSFECEGYLRLHLFYSRTVSNELGHNLYIMVSITKVWLLAPDCKLCCRCVCLVCLVEWSNARLFDENFGFTIWRINRYNKVENKMKLSIRIDWNRLTFFSCNTNFVWWTFIGTQILETHKMFEYMYES